MRCAIVLLALLALAGCGERIDEGTVALLAVDPASPELTADPDLRARLAASPHRYFRFVERPFTQAVCRLFPERERRIPDVNLHGDAHLEQYAVTDVGYGLHDFDRAVRGPATVDLVRFATSLRLACRQRGWDDGADAAIDEFLEAYVAALASPDAGGPEPAVVARARTSWDGDRARAVDRTAGLMGDLQAPRAAVDRQIAAYVEDLRSRRPEIPAARLAVKAVGGLRIGIGSALDMKHLVRMEGPGPGDADDLFVEIKQVDGRRAPPCLANGHPGDPRHIVTVAERLGRHPDPLAGSALVPEGRFLVGGWFLFYRAMQVDDPELTLADLHELAADVGRQLGGGHPRGLPDEAGLRRELATVATDLEPRILAASRDLADAAERAWLRFAAGLAE